MKGSSACRCSMVVIHHEKCSARHTRRKQVTEYASSADAEAVEYQLISASARTRASATARFIPLAPVGGTICAASPTRYRRPFCIGSTTKLSIVEPMQHGERKS